MDLIFFRPPAGSGPGVLLVPDEAGFTDGIQDWARKLAEDGYHVAVTPASGEAPVDVSEAALDVSKSLDQDAHIAAIGIGEGAGTILSAGVKFDATVLFDPPQNTVPGTLNGQVVLHTSGGETHPLAEPVAALPDGRVHLYDHCQPGFIDTSLPAHDKWAARIAYSRTLAPLRRVMGPYYDLAGLFAKHLRLEFVEKDAHATMETMIEEPYVNHVPTRTGGVGHQLLERFYKYHFIPTQPEDRQNTVISETVGADTVVLEILGRFTHDKVMDHMLPGIPPSGKKVELPVVVVASFRGDKLYNEHIYWDQASLLTQVGALEPGDLPISGAVAAHKLEDIGLPSNELMPNWADSEGKPL